MAETLEQVEDEYARTRDLLDSLREADLDAVDPATGWTVRQILAHAAVGQMGEAFFIRAAGMGQVMEMSADERDAWNVTETERASDWGLDRLRTEFEEALETLREAVGELSEEQMDNAIAWPSYPARTIRESFPFMAGHQAEHRADVERALGR